MFFTLAFLIGIFECYSQLDSVSFQPMKGVQLQTMDNSDKSLPGLGNDKPLVFTIGGSCKYVVPVYSQLVDGVTSFKKIKMDAKASLSALGSTLSVEKKSEFYVYYLTRSRSFYCPENSSENKVRYGVGVYVILKISNLNTKVDIKTPYDIAAVGQLGLAKVELDVRHFGMKPDLAAEFLPDFISKVDVESAKYFDKVLEASKKKISDTNTIPTFLPGEI